MRGTLLLAVLNIQSSYSRNIEESFDGSSGVPDTLQWWITPESAWRIKTYALDHDIHTHSVAAQPDFIELARSNNRKHYEGSSQRNTRSLLPTAPMRRKSLLSSEPPALSQTWKSQRAASRSGSQTMLGIGRSPHRSRLCAV